MERINYINLWISKETPSICIGDVNDYHEENMK